MTPLFKSLLGIGLAGGGAGLSVGGYYLFKFSESTTLLEKFNKDGIEVLDYKTNSSESDWTTKLNGYKTDTVNKFKDLDLSGSGTEEIKKLKDKCKEYLEKPLREINEEDLEDKVKKWCAKDKPRA